jgi:DNA-binding CsgD family transcriptional regulator
MHHDYLVTIEEPRPVDLLTPLVVLGVVVALASAGFAHGFWLANIHNGLLALAFGGVAAWTLLVRPGQREALLLAAVSGLEGPLFLGRQVAHTADPGQESWWGWLGVWPLAALLGLLTWAVLCFPAGGFLSRSWRTLGLVVAVVAAALALVSALWPVEYQAAGIDTAAPFHLAGAGTASDVWDVVAHPVYALLQVTWLVGVLARWRQANGILRNQLALLAVAVGVATTGLLIGVAIWGSPRLGLLLTPLVPIAAGWGMVSLSLSRVVEQTRATGGLASLSPRENEVLDLMAQGFSNKAISEHLHLSLKTIEPLVGSIFTKLHLPTDASTNRRVLAVRALLDE